MFSQENYSIAIQLLPRFLGLIYLCAFGAFFFQIQGLLGSHGILPINHFLSWAKAKFSYRRYYLVPSFFWINSSDMALKAVVISGIMLSLLLILGVTPALMLFVLYFLYLSIVSTGQDFLSFGWEGFFLEISVNAFFLSLSATPSIMVWISINLLLFRFFFEAGAVKLQSGDPNWKNLTALAYHYQSQPIPNKIAWYAHRLPLWFHKLTTGVMFIIELAVPFFIFGTEEMRLYAFFAFITLLAGIWMTGNFSYLNHLSALFCIILISNTYLSTWITAPSAAAAENVLGFLCTGAGTALLLLQLMQLWNHFFYNSWFAKCMQIVSPFHICNRYGIFAVMTTTRNEIVFEGSDDEIEWKEYLFYHKPSEITRRPRRISPYQPRLDWQTWFLPLGGYRFDPWYENFLYHLLKGTPEVLALVRGNPFPDHPPQFIRAIMYEYAFSTKQEKKEKGIWWTRRYIAVFTPSSTLGHALR